MLGSAILYELHGYIVRQSILLHLVYSQNIEH